MIGSRSPEESKKSKDEKREARKPFPFIGVREHAAEARSRIPNMRRHLEKLAALQRAATECDFNQAIGIIAALEGACAKEYESQKLLDRGDWIGLVELSRRNPDAAGIGDPLLTAARHNYFAYVESFLDYGVRRFD